LLPPLLAAGCASRRGDLATLAANSDRVIWEAGQEAEKHRDWETARQHYRRIIDGFPQSQLGPDARLALGDSHYKEGGTANYILAVSAYREFLTFYPSHPRADYAQFRVGESYFRQRNPPDRDQTPTEEALEEFYRLLEHYPDSPLADEARERVIECRQSLARSEFLIGYFYQRTRKAYRAATRRFERLLDRYPDYADLDEVLLRLGETLSLSRRPKEAAPYLARLLKEFPDSRYVPEAQALLEQTGEAAEATPEETEGSAAEAAPEGTEDREVEPTDAAPAGTEAPETEPGLATPAQTEPPEAGAPEADLPQGETDPRSD
jgi:outer membrane protein assembly factor BamD